MRVTRLVLMLTSSTFLFACANTHESSHYRDAELKDKYRYLVDRQASTKAVTVYWVNPPTNEQVRNMHEDKSQESEPIFDD